MPLNDQESGGFVQKYDFLAELPSAAFKSLCLKGNRLTLKAGDYLFGQDEIADHLYVVMSGSLGVFVDQSGNESKQLIALIGKGEITGEVAIIAGGVRSADVIALRDSDLLRISRSRFDILVKKHPEITIPISKILATRLREASRSSTVNIRPKVVSFIAATSNVDVYDAAKKVAHCLVQRFNQKVFVQETETDSLTSKKLNDLEDDYDLLILCSYPDQEAWMRRSTRQSDRVCVVTESGVDIPDGLSDLIAQKSHDHQMIDLFVLYPNEQVCPRLTQNVLDQIGVNRHFHIRVTEKKDWERWSRIITGRSVGLVLSGGGARAYAHLGAVRALQEAGIPIDYVSGSSMGGIIAASIAMGWDIDTMEDRIRSCFVETNPLSDYTLPLHGLVRGRKVERLLKENFGSVEISDLWLPFFCVSTNLTNASGYIHSRGELCDALRASISLPGVLPPVVTPEGVLVDGGVINNLPILETTRHCHGPIIAVDVSRDLALSPAAWKSQINQSLWMRMFRPPVISLLLRSGTVSGELQIQRQSNAAHINLNPPLGPIDIRNWKNFDETIRLGYDYTKMQMDQNSRLSDLSRLTNG
ncbi:MAG: patatin-like phospholipase family protein [Pseudomonadota bacterium]